MSSLLNIKDENFIEAIVDKNKNFTSSKTVLVIEPYGATIPLLRRGFEKNFNIIILTANTDFRMVPADVLDSAAISIQIETSDHHAVIDCVSTLSKLLKIDAVIPGFEYFVPIASKLSALLKVPGIEQAKVENVRRKDAMRSILKEADLTVPRFQVVSTLQELEDAVNVIGFPCVCKPVDAAGSVNVKRAANKEELIEAGERILFGNDVLWGHKLENKLLVEEYIPGKEYSLEGIIKNGKILHFSITEKFVSDQDSFIEIGHVVNVPIEVTLKHAMQDYVNKVIEALGADNCPFHAEIRLGNNHEPILMEIAARLAGDKIGELITLSRNVNYFDHVYAAYLGDDLPIDEMTDDCAGIRFFYRPNVDHYSVINGIEAAKTQEAYELTFYYRPDVSIPDFPKPLRRLGHLIAKSADYSHLLTVLSNADANIHFEM